MNGIFDGRVTYALGTQSLNIPGLDLIRRQGQLFDQVQCCPQSVIDRGAGPVV